MCGIAGVFPSASDPRLANLLQECTDLATHRGPDGRGQVLGHRKGVCREPSEAVWGLGHVRLAVLDTTDAGLQPMAGANGQHWICYNGEVYNYLELRQELEVQGYSFHTGTDTEVVLAAYDRWGTDAIRRLVGMFAFILVDLRAGIVLVVRDPLGVKPLYLWTGGGRTVVVSEPKQLAAFPDFHFQANQDRVLEFLVGGWLGHVADDCCLKGVHPLRPGSFLTWKLGEQADRARTQTYWTPGGDPLRVGWEDAVRMVGDLFRDSVRLRLRSDVPVGSCLSGGVDSSSIVGVVGRELGVRMNTFSSCFPNPEFDEQTYIDAVVGYTGSIPTKIFPGEEECIAELESITYQQDEPFASLSVYAQWCVMRAARRAGVPVLLDGQGGDEVLCGYRKYAYFYTWELLRAGRVAAGVSMAAKFLRNGDSRLLRLREGERYFPPWFRRRAGMLENYLRPPTTAPADPWMQAKRGPRRLHDWQRMDLARWSLPVLLRYEDRNSMAHSVEARIPFLDYRLVDLCMRLPEEYFFRHGRTKRLLVEAMGETLPALVRERKTKLGFETPQSIWMQGKLGAHLEARILRCRPLDTWIDLKRIGNEVRALRAGASALSQATLFRMLSVALWIDRFDVQL